MAILMSCRLQEDKKRGGQVCRYQCSQIFLTIHDWCIIEWKNQLFRNYHPLSIQGQQQCLQISLPFHPYNICPSKLWGRWGESVQQLVSLFCNSEVFCTSATSSCPSPTSSRILLTPSTANTPLLSIPSSVSTPLLSIPSSPAIERGLCCSTPNRWKSCVFSASSDFWLFRLRLEAEGVRAGSVILGRGAYGTVVLGRYEPFINCSYGTVMLGRWVSLLLIVALRFYISPQVEGV